MIFIETIIFTRLLPNYLNDDSYKDFQIFLQKQPEAGDLIQGTGGLRKLRWKLSSKGKRGGIRIIYFWNLKYDQIYLMTLYGKNEIVNLSQKEKKLLKQMLERW